MNFVRTFALLYSICLVAPSASIAQSALADDERRKISRVVDTTRENLRTVGYPAARNPLFQEPTLRNGSPSQRAAALVASMDALDAHQNIAFPNSSTNSINRTLAITSRIHAVSRLRALMPQEATGAIEILLNDYLDGELADLKLSLLGKINEVQYQY